nr:hypothetical protein [Acetivibrio ethanolgignens]
MNELKLPEDEYYGVAAAGLQEAAMNYNDSKGYRFSTYAYRKMWEFLLLKIKEK